MFFWPLLIQLTLTFLVDGEISRKKELIITHKYLPKAKQQVKSSSIFPCTINQFPYCNQSMDLWWCGNVHFSSLHRNIFAFDVSNAYLILKKEICMLWSNHKPIILSSLQKPCHINFNYLFIEYILLHCFFLKINVVLR